jgi:ribosome maturation factor RimP
MIAIETLENLIKTLGAELYDTEITREGTRVIFRVYIDREGGVDVEICARVSRAISPLLDTDPPVSGAYFLEVSSPGIERKLRTARHFAKAIGSRVKVTLKDKTRVKGELKSANDREIVIDEESFAIDQIAKAHIVFVN